MLQDGNQCVSLSPSERGLVKIRGMSPSPTHPQSLAKCLAHKKYSIHVGLMNEGMQAKLREGSRQEGKVKQHFLSL